MEKPVIFNAEMVRAILNGKKSMTRRIVKPQPTSGIVFRDDLMKRCPYKVGTRLWVRETFITGTHIGHAPWVRYRATDGADIPEGAKWTPSIFMPRKLSRINLEIKHISVERIQDISEDDAWNEGIDEKEANKRPYIDKYGINCAITVFSNLWEAINGKKGYGWAMNPWVFCYKFKKVK